MARNIIYGILIFIALIFITFGLKLFGLEWREFFGVKEQNIERKIYEETKSYSHGKLQELGRLYQQYQETEDAADKQTITIVIQMQFTNFDETKVINSKLKAFLINQRGY